MGSFTLDCSSDHQNSSECCSEESREANPAPELTREEPLPDTAVKTEELRPCPFCGSEAMFHFLMGHNVICKRCTASVSGGSFAHAASIWNRRVSDSTYVDLPVHHIMRAGIDLWLSSSGHYELTNGRTAGCAAGSFTGRAICKLPDYPYDERPRAVR